MSGSAYDSFEDPYCFKGSFVLKNRAGLRDPDALEGFELEMLSIRAEEPLPEGNSTLRIIVPYTAIYFRTSIYGQANTGP